MDIIKSSSEISTLFKEGRRVRTHDITVIVLRNDEQHGPCGRVAFVAGKKLGNAVWRNRAKRRMRSLYRDLHAPFSGYDLVFMARPSVNEANYARMYTNLEKALVNEGLINR